jgi:hypothetical protein
VNGPGTFFKLDGTTIYGIWINNKYSGWFDFIIILLWRLLLIFI